MRAVGTDKLPIQVLLAVMARVAPPVEGLTVTDQISLLGIVSSQSRLSTPDTLVSLVTTVRVISC